MVSDVKYEPDTISGQYEMQMDCAPCKLPGILFEATVSQFVNRIQILVAESLMKCRILRAMPQIYICTVSYFLVPAICSNRFFSVETDSAFMIRF